MVINLLDDEDFKHHDGVKGLRPTLAGCREPKVFLKRLPVNEFIDARENVISRF